MSKRPVAREPGRAFAQCSDEARTPAWLVTAAAGLVHASLFGAALYLSSPAPSLAAKPSVLHLLEVELAPPPAREEKAPEPTPAAEPEPIKLKIAKAPPIVPPAPASDPEPEQAPEPTPPPAAAQASAAVTQDDENSAKTATLVTGDGASYAGGTTERGGNETEAVHAPNARAVGTPDGTGAVPVDHSRAPRLAAGTDWGSCPFPPEAEEDGIDRAVVGLEVEIAPNGSVLTVSVHNDPGSGFGREARACALKKHWLPALDKSGQPIQQKHRINVSFTLK